MSKNPENSQETDQDPYLGSPDALSTLLSKLQLSAEVYVNGDFCGLWAVDTSGSRRIPFHLVGRGKAWLHVKGQPEQLLSAGDLVLFPQDGAHVVSSSSETPEPEHINAPMEADDGPITNLVCGFFEFSNKAAWPILDSMPSVVVLDISDQSASPWLRNLIESLIAELAEIKPGYHAVINQLSYLIFVQVIRQLTQSGQLETGLLSALFDAKLSRALAAIHNHPSRHWTLEKLAAEAAMGRSSFAQHFSESVGIPPMQYLTNWRMRDAEQLLKSTKLSTAEIAERSGYESEVAFRKAYKKIIGIAPGQSRRIN